MPVQINQSEQLIELSDEQQELVSGGQYGGGYGGDRSGGGGYGGGGYGGDRSGGGFGERRCPPYFYCGGYYYFPYRRGGREQRF
ncbi:hypothetical protein A0J48_015505 [Sphaerospermopsis aphanizomenoides BCCUSP55]|uniref:hypothetical protein n=1 Tax=Sphaerospermopsis aphanizomenoides TaxID=459663 RepID=UPI00190515D0|nr:hypothetical protein [Sphaerospermopsis aphanizomenoides]MBK1988927.1 hypothetical protein [Sphaerospermopsis aphanizomenoides BCCUSP55]